jgi:2-polyprenyl-3-methyl-5-hydroxy-6-metoxy-1,4-benzoquinol methylase
VGWLRLERVPEPEVMDEGCEVEAYASAAAQSYLEKIDRTFVEHVARLLEPAGRPVQGLALDIGCGPGQIPILMAQRWPALRITGVDGAPAMVAEARRAAEKAGVAIAFQALRLSREAGALPFAAGSFDLVTCNSVLHHLADPGFLLDEMARLAGPAGAVLLRDLRRPAAPLFAAHARWFGRHYTGEMRRLYEASLRAAYTAEELQDLLGRSRLQGARVFRHGLTHIGIERPRSA